MDIQTVRRDSAGPFGVHPSGDAAGNEMVPYSLRIKPEPVADLCQRLARFIASDHLNDLGLSGGAPTDANASCPKSRRQSSSVDAKPFGNLRKRRSLTVLGLGSQEVRLPNCRHPPHRSPLRSRWPERSSADLRLRPDRPFQRRGKFRKRQR